jgi:uncharacterized protein (TIGR03083 family)
MDDAQALIALQTVTDAMAATVARADPAAPVPFCAGWDVTTLTDHLGRVHLWAEHCARVGAQPDRYPRRDRSVPLPRWYAACADTLLAGLSVLPPDHPSWSFSAEPSHQRAAFWRRRQVHETAIHHVDALQAIGELSVGALHTEIAGLTPAQAADGVAEVFEVMVPRTLVRRSGEAPERVVPATAPVAFTCVDTGHAWTLRLVSGRCSIGDGIADDAVATISAPAAHLYLALWHRADPDLLDVTGDRSAGRALLAASLVP